MKTTSINVKISQFSSDWIKSDSIENAFIKGAK